MWANTSANNIVRLNKTATTSAALLLLMLTFANDIAEGNGADVDL